MNQASFRRKLMYLALIVLLVFPLVRLSQPATVNTQGEREGGFGYLAQLRAEHKLDQANLGEIDPAGETMKLATFGLRGVAASLLWNKANRDKLNEDWTGLQSTLEQLSKLQPNYVSVWRFQAWNLSYNVSVEFDDYKGRYHWVKEGIKYLIKGSRYNENEHRLVSDIGWFTGQKFGRSDERVPFRREFKQDPDEDYPNHRSRSNEERDNWLVAKEYFLRAEEVARQPGVTLGTVNPLVFYSQGPMSQINFAANLEEDGIFGERASEHWRRSMAEWTRFGQQDMPYKDGDTLRLVDEEARIVERDQLLIELDAQAPGLREQLKAEKLAARPSEERSAFAVAPESRTPEEQRLSYQAQLHMQVTDEQFADRVEGTNRERALELAKKTSSLSRLINRLESDRATVNFRYWLTRCEMEHTPAAVEGRRLLYAANSAFLDADLPGSKDLYDQAFAQWRAVLDEFPMMIKDDVSGDDIMESIKTYENVLKQLDEPFPKEFILKDLVAALNPPPRQPPPGMAPPRRLPPGTEVPDDFPLPPGVVVPIDTLPPEIEKDAGKKLKGGP